MEKSKDEGRAEVGEKYLSTLPFFRRACTLIYVAWLFVEGPISAFKQWGTSISPVTLATGMEHMIMYLVIGGLLLIILHSYLGRRVPRTLFRFLLFAHQVTLAGISAWRYLRSETQDYIETGFRLILLSFCAVAEVDGLMSDILL